MAGYSRKQLRNIRVDNLIHLVEAAAPDIVGALIDSAKGLVIEDHSGSTVRTYTRPPDIRAATYLIDRVLGAVRPEPDPAIERLNTARAVLLEQQCLLLLPAQQRELIARATRAEIEGEMWPKQFVTEEEEMANMQSLARAINASIMSLTPEDMETMMKDRSPAQFLEALKEKIGRTEADIIEEVLNKKIESDEDEEQEDEEE